MSNHGTTFDIGQYNALHVGMTRVLPAATTGIDPKELLRKINEEGGINRLQGAVHSALVEMIGNLPVVAPVPTFFGRMVGSTIVVVNRRPTVEKMVELGKFDYRWDNGNINSANFPHDKGRPKKETVTIDWYEYPQSADSDPIVDDLALQRHRPMTNDETLSVAIQHPKLQLEHPRVGLGSSWVGSGRVRRVPVLDGSGTQRYLLLSRWDRRWLSIFLFGAVAL